MEEFFQKMDAMFKEYLDHPVPALLLEENKKIFNTLNGITTTEYEFKKDLSKGDLGEEFVKNFLIINGKYKFIRKNHTKEYDLLMSLNENDMHKFEVKVDFVAPRTNMIAIEEENRGKLSGINVWDCDYVVILIPQNREMGFIKLSKLKNLISQLKQSEIGRTHIDNGERGSFTTNYIFPYEYFTNNFKIISI